MESACCPPGDRSRNLEDVIVSLGQRHLMYPFNKLQLGLWVICFCTCCVSYRATSLMTSTCSADGRSKLLTESEGLIGWEGPVSMGKCQVSFRINDLFRSGPRSSCHPCPCGRRLRARPSRWAARTLLNCSRSKSKGFIVGHHFHRSRVPLQLDFKIFKPTSSSQGAGAGSID